MAVNRLDILLWTTYARNTCQKKGKKVLPMMTKSLFAIKLGTNETIMALCTKKYNIYTFAEYPECFKNLI